MIRRSLLGIALLAPATGAAGEEVFRSKLTVGGDWGYSAATGDSSVGALADERLRARVIAPPEVEGWVFFAGRFAYALADGTSRLDGSRLRDAHLNLESAAWIVDIGRVPVDGGYRLVDGVKCLRRLGEHWEVGAWGGLGADPYTTRPAVRYGGGPVLRYEAESFTVDALGDLQAVPAGLDRAAMVIASQLEASDDLEAAARLDLQHRGSAQPLAIADAALFLWARPLDSLRVDALYDAYSSLAYLSTEKQDPGITRFDQRAQELDPELASMADTLDTTTYHLTGASVRWRPDTDGVAPELAVTGRYRYHTDPTARYARATLQEGLRGLIGGRADLTLQESALSWGGIAGWSGALLVFVEPAPELGLAFDASVEAGLQPMELDQSLWAPSLYADGYLDLITGRGRFVFSGGYAFSRVLDLDVLDDHHAAMGRITWNERVRREEP